MWWRTPAVPEVNWRGMLPTEGGQVSAGAFVGPYVVPGAAGLLIAIVAHGAISQGVQSAQRKREQEAADRVLENYQGALKTWATLNLWEQAAGGRERLWDGSTAAPGAVVELMPVFSLAQDEAALFLDVTVKITPTPGALANSVDVRVLSSPLKNVASPRAHWSTDGDATLKTTAAAMLSHAVLVASQHVTSALTNTAAAAVEPAPARTHRYMQGNVERTERARQLSGDCARVILRTLREGLLSVPLRSEVATPCDVQSNF